MIFLYILGHGDAVFVVSQLMDGRVMSGSEDRKIKIWNLNTKKCELTLECTIYIYKL